MVLTWQAGLASAWLIAQVAAVDVSSWEARVDRAVALRLSGHEEEALALFREAEKERTSPRFFAQMALTEQSLGIWGDAEAHLDRALAADDAWIVKNGAALIEARKTIRGHLGTLELRGAVSGELRVDGRPIGPLPSSKPIRLEVGHHRVEVVSPGTYPFQRDVEIRAGETSRETVVLTAVSPPENAAVNPAPVAAPRAESAPSSPSKVPGILLLSVGGAAAIAGVAMVVASNARASDYNDNAACHALPSDPPACDADASAMRTYRTLSIVSFVTAGASGLLGGFLLWRAGRSTVPVHAAVSTTSVQLTFDHAF